MFSLFKSNPLKKLNKQYELKTEQAMHAQRNGDIKAFSQLSFEANEIHLKILEIEKANIKDPDT